MRSPPLPSAPTRCLPDAAGPRRVRRRAPSSSAGPGAHAGAARPLHRPRRHGRAHPLPRRGRGRSAHPVRRRQRRRRLEDQRRRPLLEVRLSRPAPSFHGGRRRRPFRSRHGLCRHGRGQPAQQRLGGQRRLRQPRRRQDLAARRPGGDPPHRAHRRPSQGRRHRLRGRPGPRLGPQPRARAVPHPRRRQVVEARPEARCRHRLRGRGGRSRRSALRPRGGLPGAARAVHGSQPRHAVRQAGRHLPQHRRRIDLQEGDRRPARAGHGPHRPGGQPQGSARPAGRGPDRPHQRRAPRGAGADRGRGRAGGRPTRAACSAPRTGAGRGRR